MLAWMEEQFDGRRIYNWREIQRRIDDGESLESCRKALGFSRSACLKAERRGEILVPKQGTVSSDRRRQYDWDAVQRFYDEGHSYLECRARFGFGPASWTKAVLRGDLVARPRLAPLNRILLTSRSRTTVKRRLIQAGILFNMCEECGATEWRGKPLSIQIDHRNGIRDDHRLENLRMLCPNCHSQTATFGAKNRGRSRVVQW